MEPVSLIPETVPNLIAEKECLAASGRVLDKYNPATGKRLCGLVRSDAADVARAVEAASLARMTWAGMPAVQRGMLLHALVDGLRQRSMEIARIVALETGKSLRDAQGETGGAITCGFFFAGEGQRLYGRTCTSGTPFKHAVTVRQPVGVAGLIVAANTPIANVAWKIFPALICGNTVVLKAAEDAPATAWIVGRIAMDAGLPPGVLNIVQGSGPEAGQPLVEHPDVGVVSFTGSTAVGRMIAEKCAPRLARVSLELGGKNPLLVCDDARLDHALDWVLASAFSNAGQRCASASRIIIFDAVYERFREMLVAAAGRLTVGPGENDFYGPVINARHLESMIETIERARQAGACLLVGGKRLQDPEYSGGYYLAPTLIEGADPDAEISRRELFGPIACLYRVQGFEEALALANRSEYGLTACIHTRNLNRAAEFARRVEAGVAIINAGTFGSEPHMPFGGLKLSGNGSREPGTEALDVYSELKNIYLNADPGDL